MSPHLHGVTCGYPSERVGITAAADRMLSLYQEVYTHVRRGMGAGAPQPLQELPAASAKAA